ncbi:MAG TPA: hypothetical protein VFV70_05825 [Hyphomonadaceae bacterium]|nr:hypothetical protein [Hyphomonadaceae bacterium]
MGGIILIALLALLIVILITPAIRARAANARREKGEPTAHDAVVSRLEDHRRRKHTADTDRSEG